MVVAALALLLAACGAHGPNAGGVSTTVDEPPPVVSEPDRDEVYEGAELLELSGNLERLKSDER